MKGIEDFIAADLGQLCANKLAEANRAAKRIDPIDSEMPRLTAPLAMLITQVDPEIDASGLVGGRTSTAWDTDCRSRCVQFSAS